MEWKIGEIFEFGGEWYQCVIQPELQREQTACGICSMNFDGKCPIPMEECASSYRCDKTSVIFKKLEKVGEPYSCNYYGDNRLIMMQEYNLYNLDDVTNEDKIPMYITDYKHKRIAIEIKQNKEGMEEKKLNLKPFDIQKAREGKPVCTRDGRKVRIICFDAKRKDEKSIIALVPSKEYLGFEDLIAYPDNGNYYGGHENDGDLMMLPEKKEGWVNVYKSLGVITFSHNPYATKEEAIKDKDNYYVDTIKVEWEE